MGDWDAPAPFYVYTFGLLAFAWLACLANAQWKWSIITGLALLANAVFGLWRITRELEEDKSDV